MFDSERCFSDDFELFHFDVEPAAEVSFVDKLLHVQFVADQMSLEHQLNRTLPKF